MNYPLTAKGQNGRVQFDGRAVTIHRGGLRDRSRIGNMAKQIPVHAVGVVEWRPAAVRTTGYIEFALPDESATRSLASRRRARHTHTAIVFTTAQMPAFESLRQAVQQAQLRPPPGPAQAYVPVQRSSIAEQDTRHGRIHDSAQQPDSQVMTANRQPPA